MPNRIIKESACTSDTLAEISAEAERLWWRLVVQADDYGCFDGRPNVILGKCLTAFIGRFRDDDVSCWLEEMESVGLIRRYEVDGRPYIHLAKWSEHQRPARAKEPKYPLPPTVGSNVRHKTTSDGNRQQMTANDDAAPDDEISRISEASRQNDEAADTCRQMTADDDRRQHMTTDAPVVGNRSRESGGGVGRAREGAHVTPAAAEMINDDSVTPYKFFETVNGKLVSSAIDMIFQEFEPKLDPSALKWGIWEAKLNNGRGAKYLKSIYQRLEEEGLTTADKAEEYERWRRDRPHDRASPDEGASKAVARARLFAKRQGGAIA